MTLCKEKIKPDSLKQRRAGHSSFDGPIDLCGAYADEEYEGRAVCGKHKYFLERQARSRIRLILSREDAKTLERLLGAALFNWPHEFPQGSWTENQYAAMQDLRTALIKELGR